jgi:hypothetical protein
MHRNNAGSFSGVGWLGIVTGQGQPWTPIVGQAPRRFTKLLQSLHPGRPRRRPSVRASEITASWTGCGRYHRAVRSGSNDSPQLICLSVYYGSISELIS